VDKPDEIELPDGTTIPILYEERAVLAIDKPAGWLLAPKSWDEPEPVSGADVVHPGR